MIFSSKLDEYLPWRSPTNRDILPPGMGGAGIIDGTDIQDIGSEVLEEMMEEGKLELEEYAREFQIKAQQRDDYRRISQEVLEEMDKDVDFLAEYSLRFEEKLENQIEEYDSDAYDKVRIDSYTLGGLFNMPEEDYRETSTESEAEEREKN